MLSRAPISGAIPLGFRAADSISLSSELNPRGVRAPLIVYGSPAAATDARGRQVQPRVVQLGALPTS